MTRNKKLYHFWAQWTLTSMLGWSLGCSSILAAFSIIGVMVIPAPEVRPGNFAWAMFFVAIVAVAGGVGGLLVGSLQWLILRRHTPGMEKWILPSIAGWALGPAVFVGANWSIETDVPSSIINQPVLVTGIAIGLLSAAIGQWLVLSHKVRQAAWWIPVNIVGTGLAGGTAYAFSGWALNLDSLCLGLILPGVPAGVTYGLVTGWGLWMILQLTRGINENRQVKGSHQSAC